MRDCLLVIGESEGKKRGWGLPTEEKEGKNQYYSKTLTETTGRTEVEVKCRGLMVILRW